MERFPAVVEFGPPCAGKGTAGSALAENLSAFHHISSGDLVRGILDKGGILANKLHSFVDNGILIPDDVILPILRDEVKKRVETGIYNPEKQILLADGMYRTRGQAKSLEDFLDVKEVYHFTNLPNIILMQRNNTRVLESKDKKKPRTDDHEKAMKRRIQEYYSDTHPTLDYFVEKKIPIFCVDALPPKDVVFNTLHRYAIFKIPVYRDVVRA